DTKSIDLLVYLAHALNELRLLIVCTGRLPDLALYQKEFLKIKQDLEADKVLQEIELAGLSRKEIEHHLDLKFPGNKFPPQFSRFIHRKTEGNPLLMVDFIQDLCYRGVINNGQLTTPTSNINYQLRGSAREMGQRM